VTREATVEALAQRTAERIARVLLEDRGQVLNRADLERVQGVIEDELGKSIMSDAEARRMVREAIGRGLRGDD